MFTKVYNAKKLSLQIIPFFVFLKNVKTTLEKFLKWM